MRGVERCLSGEGKDVDQRARGTEKGSISTADNLGSFPRGKSRLF